MAETNAAASTGSGFWGKLGSVLQDKAIDLADSYATLKLGKDTAKTQATGTPVMTAPSTAPAAVQAPMDSKKLMLWIGGGLLVVVVLIFAFRRPRGR